jgi:hypothetical protein
VIPSKIKESSIQLLLFYQFFAIGIFSRHVFVDHISKQTLFKVLLASIVAGLILLYSGVRDRDTYSRNYYILTLVVALLPFTWFVWAYLYSNN